MQAHIPTNSCQQFVYKHLTWLATILMLSLLVACSSRQEGQALVLTNWLQAHKNSVLAEAQGGKPGDAVQLSYSVRRQKNWWLISFSVWDALDYDEVNVLDDKTILVGRTVTFAKSLFGNSIKQSDTYVKLMAQDGRIVANICAYSASINAPAKASFIDCVDASDDKKRLIKRLDFQGHLLQTFGMEANQWEDLTTAKNIAFYDEQGHAYLLETAKNDAYCHLIMPDKTKNLSFSLSDKSSFTNCSDLAAWQKVTGTRLMRAENFGKLGKQAQFWQQLHPVPSSNQ